MKNKQYVKFILLLPFFLFAKDIYIDFNPCYKKFKYIKNDIPITSTKSVTFNRTNCIYYDKFTKMCVINSKNKRVVKFFNYPKLGWWAASIKKNEIYVGNYAMEGLLANSKLSIKTIKNSVISDMFCRAIGIGDGNGFIKGDMVKHFVNYGYWGDIGIDVDENMRVISFDPYYVKDIKLGEKIKKINNKYANYKTFAKYVLQNSIGKIVKLQIDNKIIKVKIRKKLYMYTPLEHFDIKVNKKLIVTKLPESIIQRYYFRPGCKIVKINNNKISSFDELKKALSTYKNATITLNQNGIEFKIPLKEINGKFYKK